MGNPQIEDGYTKIANELLIALCKIRISGEARQIFDVILRLTYGFNKKTDAISLSKFEEFTGMPRPTCSRAIKKLLDMNLIFVDKDKYITRYSINKNYLEWQVLTKKITIKSVDKNDNSSLTKMITVLDKNDNKTVDNNDTYKRKKETIKETIKERETNFKNTLIPYAAEYPKSMLNDFYLYWSEPSGKLHTKMRWELEKSWDLSRRLKRWYNNELKWNKNNGRSKPSITADELNEFIQSIANDPDLK